MSIINDFFNHKANIEKRKKELKALDDAIAAKVKDVDRMSEKIVKLQSKLAEIKVLFPNATEEEALQAYFKNLQRRNAMLEDENIDLGLKIATKKRELETLQTSITEFRSSLVRPEDVVFAVYKVGDECLAINAFLYVGYASGYSATYEQDIYFKYYRSLGGERSIGLNMALGEIAPVNEDNPQNKYVVNTEPIGYCRFGDWCIFSDYSLHLNSMISIEQINEVLESFRSNYILDGEGDDIHITRKRVPSGNQIYKK